MSSLRHKAGRVLVRAGHKTARLGEVFAMEGWSGLSRLWRKRLARSRGEESFVLHPSGAPSGPAAGSPRKTGVNAENYLEKLRLGPGEYDRLTVLGPEAYGEMIAVFDEMAAARGLDSRRLCWYHTVDLGEGFVTPGMFDYREALPLFGFPEDLTGRTVLDVGPATGFFTFEFERRGAAEVTAVDLPSIAQWDMPPGEDRDRTLREMMEHYGVDSVEEVTRRHVEEPFQFCARRLGSKARRVHSDIYSLTAEKAGRGGFDLVFLGDVLEHTFAPLKALAQIAPLCKGELIVTSLYPVAWENEPVMVYTGGADRRGDNRTWWYPTLRCLDQILRRLGFREVTSSIFVEAELVTDVHSGRYRRAVIHARR